MGSTSPVHAAVSAQLKCITGSETCRAADEARGLTSRRTRHMTSGRGGRLGAFQRRERLFKRCCCPVVGLAPRARRRRANDAAGTGHKVSDQRNARGRVCDRDHFGRRDRVRVRREIRRQMIYLITWEFPRLCRGGSRSLTYTAVVLRETCDGLRHDVMRGQQGQA